MNTNITKTWTISIDADEVFARCSNETLYQSYRRSDAKIDDMVIGEDDKEQFMVYFDAAVAELYMLLARRMEEAPLNAENGSEADGANNVITFILQMHANHDNTILPVLINHCYAYVVKKVLEQWYLTSFGSELERLEINHCLHYRKHPVRRRIGPLF
jgi:hypothetical protein